MINASELRIDNWVMYNGVPQYIIGIESSLKEIDPIIGHRIYNSVRTSLTLQESIFTSKLEPIAITEDILNKIEGFVYDGGEDYWRLEVFKSRTITDTIEISFYPPNDLTKDKLGVYYSRHFEILGESNGLKLTNIEFLHQLQNAVFSIAHKELEINLP